MTLNPKETIRICEAYARCPQSVDDARQSSADLGDHAETMLPDYARWVQDALPLLKELRSRVQEGSPLYIEAEALIAQVEP